jgi:hypothetical protein
MRKTMSKTTNHENDTLLDTIENSITGQDEPMVEVHPSAPLWLVMGMYPLVLLVAIAIALSYFAYTNFNDDGAPTEPSVSSTV